MSLLTPLYSEHLASQARMVEFAGWQMPIQYTGIIAEHLHCRARTAIFDTSHMGEFIVSGPTAVSDLDRLLTLDVASMDIGQCRYGYLLQEDGGVLDDLTCYRQDNDCFLLVVNAAPLQQDADWIQAHLSSSTEFDDQSANTAKIDIQGPESRQALAKAMGYAVPNLKFFRACEWPVGDISCWLSRTGYTGEWGYELYLPSDHAPDVWQRLLTTTGVLPAGLGARDTLRLEVGYPLYGQELQQDRTPVAAVGSSFMNLDKSFIGRTAVQRELEDGPVEQLVGLILEGKRAARAGDKVVVGDIEVGIVTSGSFAPSIGAAVAMAYVTADVAANRPPVECISRTSRLPATIQSLPFYRDGTARKK